MAQIKNISDQDREVPRLFGRVHVPKGGVLDVGDDELESFTCQSDVWQSMKPTKTEKD